ncbi:hypothetical protein [uncultured Deinococcus sp.]|uniref:hypothetical protein n=1 Tax=uncultured Deinococcus sp. TaxID=158789 RepID=UPI00258E1716|nr:hypothetical protein [uncultured Deinococcus sp.]
MRELEIANPQKTVDLSVALEQAARGKSATGADSAVFRQLAASLEQAGWPPDAFDLADEPDRRTQRPFQAEAFAEAMAGANLSDLPRLRRQRSPAYGFAAGLLATPRLSPTLDFGQLPASDLEAAFGLADALCELFRPVYAAVSFRDPDAAEPLPGRISSGRLVHRYGFEVVPPRCYVGAELLDNFDLPALRDLGVDVTPTDWGAVCLDALKDPWAVPSAELSAQLQRLGAYFAERGLMGDYSRALVKKAGANWKPVQAT